MKIKIIKVIDLFDYYCYEIKIKAHDPISIIHAPNGYGKTTVFKMITYLLNLDIYNMCSIPFTEFILELSDNTIISVKNEKRAVSVRKQDGLTRKRTFPSLILKVITNAKEEYILPLQVNDRSIAMIKEDGIEEYIRRMEMRRRNIPVEYRVEEDANTNLSNAYETFREHFEKVANNLEINFIDSNRLFSNSREPSRKRIIRKDRSGRERVYWFSPEDEYVEYSERESTGENIIKDAIDILQKIQEARQIYSLESEKKDRDFPDRLVEYVNSVDDFFDDDKIAEELEELEKKRLELENTGLVLSGKKTLTPSKGIDDTMRKFYTLYIKDTLEKLSLYDEIKAKIELFIEIINRRTSFSNKIMRIDSEKGVVFEPINSKSGNKNRIPLDKLSSGEKHDFIMFYELIFNSDKASVFLIDEPEISLHVAWQMQFIDVLERICKLTGTQAIVATHSPDIVNGHDDLLISLGLEDEDNEN